MAKVTINGEVFEWDAARKPMSEALAIEQALGIPYVQYEQGLETGSARSLAGFCWLVWRRNGRDVPLADILSGAVDIDLNSLDLQSDEGGETGPTMPTPTASDGTGTSTSESSPKSSASAPGKRAS